MANPETERERITREYDEALETRYQRGKALRAQGKRPHEIVRDPSYAAAESRIQRLQGESSALAEQEARETQR